MLVLSRKTGQSIEIGEGITVTVTQIKGNKVRLGIKAPAEVPIHRHELTVDDSQMGGGLILVSNE
jgi:carbon storage regulator